VGSFEALSLCVVSFINLSRIGKTTIFMHCGPRKERPRSAPNKESEIEVVLQIP
jgi:hypothetical protein